jgi:AbiV family abortive infection protein
VIVSDSSRHCWQATGRYLQYCPTNMTKPITKYKFKKLAAESLKNGLRLHFDSILLYRSRSYPSALQLSILALEEISKSYWIEHYYDSSITNTGFPDIEFEQSWLKLLYVHTKKHQAFVGWGWSEQYHKSFVESLRNGDIDKLKQTATYVGLERLNRGIDTKGRISTPEKIKAQDARKMISVINDHLLDRCEMKEFYGNAYQIEEKDDVLTDIVVMRIKGWGHNSGLRKEPLFKTHVKRWSKQ